MSERGLFYCTIYRKGKRHVLFSTDWVYLRRRVGEELRKMPGSRWGMLKRDDEVLDRRVRHSLHSYPMEEPK
jgi:hypothetical protein